MIRDIRIDDALWGAASRVRREDWRISIAELTREPALGSEDEHVLHLGSARHAVVLATFDEQGAPLAVYEVARAELKHHVDEYLAIIHRMQSGESSDFSASMHTLDMAKKVVHDAGARTLARTLPTLAPDHETYRRLFSLLVAIVVDVTTLPGAIAHRRHA
jgi:uncharacterized protein (UPF0262 family)